MVSDDSTTVRVILLTSKGPVETIRSKRGDSLREIGDPNFIVRLGKPYKHSDRRHESSSQRLKFCPDKGPSLEVEV